MNKRVIKTPDPAKAVAHVRRKQKSIATESEAKVLPEGEVGLFYADAVVTVGFGPLVSRFTLGVESSPGKVKPRLTVVMPTVQLVEAFAAMNRTFNDNPDLRKHLIDRMDIAKSKLEANP